MSELIYEIIVPQAIKSIRNRIRIVICNILSRSALLLLLETFLFYAIIKSLQYFDHQTIIVVYIHGLMRTLHVTYTLWKLGWKIHAFKEKYMFLYSLRRRLNIYIFVFVYLGVLQLLLWFWYNVGLGLSIISFSLLFFLYKEVFYAYSLQLWILNRKILIYFSIYLFSYLFSALIIC